MALRVAFLASECEPWAKTGGLADVVDALARALGGIGGDALDAPVEVFLPRYRSVAVPESIERATVVRVPDPRTLTGTRCTATWMSMRSSRGPERRRW